MQVRPALWDSRLSLMERNKNIKEKLWLEIYSNFKGNISFTKKYADLSLSTVKLLTFKGGFLKIY